MQDAMNKMKDRTNVKKYVDKLKWLGFVKNLRVLVLMWKRF